MDRVVCNLNIEIAACNINISERIIISVFGMQSVIVRNKFERAVSNGQTVLCANRVFRSLYLNDATCNGNLILAGNTVSRCTVYLQHSFAVHSYIILRENSSVNFIIIYL